MSDKWRWRQHKNGRWHVFRFRLARISACGCVSGEPESAPEPGEPEQVQGIPPGPVVVPAGRPDLCGSCMSRYKAHLLENFRKRKKHA